MFQVNVAIRGHKRRKKKIENSKFLKEKNLEMKENLDDFFRILEDYIPRVENSRS